MAQLRIIQYSIIRIIDDGLLRKEKKNRSHLFTFSEELRYPWSKKRVTTSSFPVVMKIGISRMLEATPHLGSYKWIILISFWVLRNQFVLHRNAICSWSLSMRLEFFPLLGICFIMEWNFELTVLDLFYLMHFNVSVPQISSSIGRIIPVYVCICVCFA